MHLMKYAAITLNALALLLVGYALFGVYSLMAQRTPISRSPVLELKPMPERALTEEQVAGTLDAISLLVQRAKPSQRISERTLLAVPRAGDLETGANAAVMPQRDVTMVVQSNGTMAAVIDNRLVRVGEALPNGGRVLRIAADHVLVRERTGRQTLSLPFERLQVGTLRTAEAPKTTVAQQQLNADVRAPVRPEVVAP
jgi:hypothetical protein